VRKHINIFERKKRGENVNQIGYSVYIFMFAKNEKGIDSLVSTVHAISRDIRMEYGFAKCDILILKRGKVVKCLSIKLTMG